MASGDMDEAEFRAFLKQADPRSTAPAGSLVAPASSCRYACSPGNYGTSRARRVRARARESRERPQLMEQLDYHLLYRQFVRRTATGCSMRA